MNLLTYFIPDKQSTVRLYKNISLSLLSCVYFTLKFNLNSILDTYTNYKTRACCLIALNFLIDFIYNSFD